MRAWTGLAAPAALSRSLSRSLALALTVTLALAGCEALGIGGSADDESSGSSHGAKKGKKDRKDRDGAHGDGDGRGDGKKGDADAKRDEGEPDRARTAAPADPLAPAKPASAGPVVIQPPVPPLEPGMMDHALVALGWSTDGAEIGWCSESGMNGGTRCEFAKGGKLERLTDFDPSKGEPAAAKTKAIAKRAADRGYGAAAPEWAWGSDLVVTWTVVADTTLKVGARVRDEKDAGWAVTLKATEGAYTIHAETVALSPDGAALGVVSHDFAGEGGDSFNIKVVPAAEAAGRAYNAAGYAHHKKGDYAAAAELFRKAFAADDKFETAVYNLACALARLKDPAAEAALRKAIEVGGAKTMAKARKDADFEGVRAEAWFTDATK
jgi:hypothetical protein